MGFITAASAADLAAAHARTAQSYAAGGLTNDAIANLSAAVVSLSEAVAALAREHHRNS